MTTDQSALAQRFEENRPHLRGVAYRLLGSAAEADDAVQEAWIRLARSDADAVDNLGGWLTTVVARVSLDMLRARTARREAPPTTAAGPEPGAPAPGTASGAPEQAAVAPGSDPAEEAVLASSVGAALLVVLETLAPAERLAFVLHDTFGVTFDEVGRVLGRSPSAAKQLAHRARLKVRGAAPGEPSDAADPARQRQVVEAFLAAARQGDFEALLTLLHPDVVLDADDRAVRLGSPASVAGASGVAGMFSGRALGAQPALIDGAVGMAWAVDGGLRVAWDVAVEDGRIVHIDMIAAPESLSALEFTLLDA
jgi:RNA polymerase sigma-70 factor (ECF subfamily)